LAGTKVRQGVIAMKMDLRLSGALFSLTLATVALSGIANAQSVDREPVLPQQVITGADDARPATNARATAAAVNTEAQRLEQELRTMTDESSEGLVAVKRADSGVTVDLEGRFMSVLVATPTEDGGHAVSCHTGHDALTQADQARDIAAGKAPMLAVKHEHAEHDKPVQAPAPEEK
jgi:hypothetical protein